MPTIRRHPQQCVAVLAWLALQSILLTHVPVSSAQPSPSPLKVDGAPRFTLTPCNAAASGAFEIVLRNAGSVSVPLALTTIAPSSKATGKTATAIVQARLVETPSSPLPDSGELRPNAAVLARLDVAGFLEPGDWDIELRNAGIPFGTVVITKQSMPFNVSLDVPNPDRTEVAFTKGAATRIALKNEDDAPTAVLAEYSVRGGSASPRVPLSLRPKGSADLEMLPPDSWFGSWLTGLFKDDTVDSGVLRVHRHAPDCPGFGPSRTFKIHKTTLTRVASGRREWLANLILLGTLCLGGVCSAFLNYALPIQSRRRAARLQLSLVDRRVADLPVQMDSRLRIAVGVEQRQLADRLHRLKWHDGQFSTSMNEIEEGIKRLRTRLDLLADLDLVVNRYWRLRSEGLPSGISTDVEDLRRQLIELLRRAAPNDTAIKTAQGLVQMMDERLAKANTESREIASALFKQLESIRAVFTTAANPIAASPLWAAFRAELSDPFEDVLGPKAPTRPEDITPADYARLTRRIAVMEDIRDFIGLCGVSLSPGDMSAAQKEWYEALKGWCRAGGSEDLNRARRLVGEIREAIFTKNVEAEFTAGRVVVEPTRIPVRQFEPTELRLSFRNRQVQNARAREEYTYEWDFGHDGLKAIGWTVSHFFPRATEPDPYAERPGRLRRLLRWVKPLREPQYAPPYIVKVRCTRDIDGQEFAVAERKIGVWPPVTVRSQSLLMELGRLSLALSIAAVGLIAGAREQVLKLDVLPALIAVFFLGFGSDRIKNLFMPRTTSEPAPAAQSGAQAGTSVAVVAAGGGATGTRVDI